MRPSQQIRNASFRRSAGMMFVCGWIVAASGCSLFPEKRSRERLHNPFPQIRTVAVLPFFNQSSEPTVDGRRVAEAYFASLQSVPGYEVLPVGVVRLALQQFVAVHGEPTTPEQFQALARFMDAEAVVVGSVTDFQSYYPPRMSLSTRWYAADDGFHPIPVGYGLPWGTEAEEHIPRRIVRDTEFGLARAQLATQAPSDERPGEAPALAPVQPVVPNAVPFPPPVNPRYQSAVAAAQIVAPVGYDADDNAASNDADIFLAGDRAIGLMPPVQSPDQTWDQPINGAWHGDLVTRDRTDRLPPMAIDDVPPQSGPPPIEGWPDATDLLPDPPTPVRPPRVVNREPVLTHTAMYRGDDPYVTGRLADYVETGDDARGNAWQGYLRRSDDFIRFCCHLHITEMLESRGGRDPSDLILKWDHDRY